MPEPLNVAPDPGEMPMDSITAADEPPDPGPMTLEEEIRGAHGRHERKSNDE